MNGLVSIPDFMAHLKAEGLVIINAADFAEANALRRAQNHAKWLKQKSMTYAHAADIIGQSRRTLERMIEKETVRPNELLTIGGVKHIMTITVKRLAGL
jgi:DNA-binding XRE family transcriptional regulator